MKKRFNKNGLILVAVLWIVVLLTLIVTSVTSTSRLNLKLSLGSVSTVQCKWAARAGTETAEAILNEDLKNSDTLLDIWSDNPEEFNDVPLGDCRFTVRIFDEAAKLNINTATKEQLLSLPNMTEQIADAIIDWRDSDDSQSPNGAETGFYENLPFRYRIRNGVFRTVRELLMVKDVTEQLLYGEDTNLNGRLDSNEKDGDKSPPNDNGDNILDKGWIEYLTCYSYETNVDADGNQRININQANEQQLTQSLGLTQPQARAIVNNRRNNQYSSIVDLIDPNNARQSTGGTSGRSSGTSGSAASEPMDIATFTSIADKITVDSQQQAIGKVNINTAPEIVLAALLGGNDRAYQIADNIVNYRISLPDGMTGIADILNVSLMDTATFRTIEGSITVRSNVYMIRSSASFVSAAASGGETVLQTEVVVDRNSWPVQILSWYEGETN
jgi:type II secretory pathway component PulK